MIIVDGPDGSGKSTLIEGLGYLPRKFRALRAGIGATQADGAAADTATTDGWANPDDEAQIAYARAIHDALREEAAQHHTSKIAFDRFHVCETIYGPMLRGASGITADEVKVLHRLITARAIPVILCLPPFETALKNVSRAGRERPAFQTNEFLENAYEGFSKIRMSFMVDTVYDYTIHPEPYLPPLKPSCPPGVVGSPSARYLVVGERSNLPLDLPFFSMGGSSGYVNRALWDAGFIERDLAFTNAQDHLGLPRDLHAIVLGMAQVRRVILLGQTAAKTAEAQRLADVVFCSTLPHPQFWKRFHANEMRRYVEMLKDVR